MAPDIPSKWQAIGTRCSAFASCCCLAALLFTWLCPVSAFGLTRIEVTGILWGAELFAMVLSVANALLAIGMIVRFPEGQRSPWLLAAIVLPVVVIFFAPAIQT